MSGVNIQQNRVTVRSDDFTLTKKLGEGAEGTVYRLPSSNEVVKIFEEGKRRDKSEKVRAMIANDPTDPTYEQSNSDIRSIVWPTATVKHPDTGDFLGYTMPYKDLADHKNACRYARENLQWNASNPEDRYETALNLLRVVRAIHEQGHAIGDLNHQNILINDGYVSVIDCDAFHILHADINKTYGDDVYFPRYAPPEGRGKTLRAVRRGDRFGIAIHLFQLLMEGFHPFQAQGDKAASGGYGDMIEANRFPYIDPIPGEIEPHSAAPDYSDLPAEVRQLFSDCFCETAKEYTFTRPSLEDWKETLKSETSEQDTSSGSGSGTSTDPTKGLEGWGGGEDTTNSDDSDPTGGLEGWGDNKDTINSGDTGSNEPTSTADENDEDSDPTPDNW